MPPPLKEVRKLTFVEIVMNADAATIKAAYEARVEVDKLLALREEAYRQIADLETKVEDLMGQAGLFVFPPPPLAVAGLEAAAPRPRKAARAEASGEAPAAAVSAHPDLEEPAAEGAQATVEKAAVVKPDGPERPASRGPAAARSH
jgi:hypothetical protein